MKLDELIGLVDTLVTHKTQKHLRDIDVAVLRGAWEGNKYEDIAQNHNYTSQYLKKDVGPKLWKLLSEVLEEKVSKKNFRGALERLGHHYLDPLPPIPAVSPDEIQSHAMILVDDDSDRLTTTAYFRDWGDAVKSGYFFGREMERATLQQWCLTDRCRLVTLLGMGGIGKTALAVNVAQSIQSDYEFVIWRSLRNAPSLTELLLDLIKFLSRQTEIQLPESLPEQLNRLLHYLRESRCLIVLDNLESLLASETTVGHYLEGFEPYRVFFQALGEQPHQSTVFVTSREKTREISLLEGVDLPVRTLMIKGIEVNDAQAILEKKGCFGVSDQDMQALTDHYGGNPLALKIVAAAIQELTGGNLAELMPFLRQGFLQFDDITDILARQFNRLSTVEQHVLYWLAINREPVTMSELAQDIVSDAMGRKVPEAIQSLTRRSLIEHHHQSLSLQPVVMEYVTARLVTGMSEDILKNQLGRLQTFALMKATSKDYVQQSQKRFILQAVVDELLTALSSHQKIEVTIRKLFQLLRDSFRGFSGYAAGNLINLMRSLQLTLNHLDLSGLTVWQADFVDADLHGVNLSAADVAKTVFTSVLNATVTLAFSPNGQYLAMGNGDNKLRVRDVTHFKELHIGEGHSNWVSCVTFSPDSQTLVSGSFDQSLRLWDVESGACHQILTGHQGWIWTVAYSPDGQFLASAGNDCTIRIWSVVQGECIKSWEAGEGWIWSVAFSPDGQQLVSGGDDQSVKVWSVATGECLFQMDGHQGRVSTVTFSPDGQIIASSSFDKTIRIWNRETQICDRTLVGHSHTVLSLALTSVGTPLLASSSQDFTVRLWDYQTGQCLKTLQGHPSGVWAVAFHPDGQSLASCSNDSMVKLWDVHTGRSLRTLRGYSAGIKAIAVAVNPAQKLWVATAGDDEEVKLWDVAQMQLAQRLIGHSRWVRGLSFSASGQWIASSGNDATVRVWDCETGKVVKVLRGHGNMVYTVAFGPEDSQLASGSDDQTVRLWNLQTMDAPKVLIHNSRVWSVCFSPDGDWLATGCDDNTVKIWDLEKQACIRSLEGHANLVASVAFSPDGKVLVSASDDRTIRVWDWQAGSCSNILKGHGATVWAVAFSQDGTSLASGSFDQTVKLWDWQGGDCCHTLMGSGGEVWAVAFAEPRNHGQRLTLFSGSQDGTLTQWDCETGEKLNSLCDQRPYENMNIQNTTGLTEAQRSSLKILGAFE